MKRKATTAVVLAALTWQAPALCEVTLGEGAGWTVTTEGEGDRQHGAERSRFRRMSNHDAE